MNNPIIRLEVDRMKYEVLHAFTTHSAQLAEEIEKQLDAVIANFPFDAVVQKVAYDVLEEEIKNYFRYGDGHEFLSLAVTEAIRKALAGPEE